MKEVCALMAKTKIVLNLHAKADEAIWNTSDPDTLAIAAPHDWRKEEATFVDDEAFLIRPPMCAKLDSAIDTVTEIVTSTFKRYGLIINWKPGKTEAMMRYRHKNLPRHWMNADSHQARSTSSF